MKLIIYALAAFLAFLGVVLMIAAGAANAVIRLSVGGVLLAAGVALVWLARRQAVQHTHVHQMQLDLTGDVSLENMICRQCGAELGSDSVSVAAGAVYVKCAYCGAQYQLEEEAKW